MPNVVNETIPISKNPAWAIDEYANIRLTLLCNNAEKFPIVMVKIDKTANKMETASADFLDILQEPTHS